MGTNERKRAERMARLAIISPILEELDAEIYRLRKEAEPLRRERYYITEREKFVDIVPPYREPKPPRPPNASLTEYNDNRKVKQRSKMSGRTHSEETKQKMRDNHKHKYIPRAITTPFGEFESINSAARHIGMTPACVFQKLNAERNTDWQYLERPSTKSFIVQTRTIPVISPDGIYYPTMSDAYKATGISLYLIQKSIITESGWKRG